MPTTIDEQIGKEKLRAAIASIPLRAEKQPELAESTQSFVPIIDLGLLATPNTQIVYGRNGTGKTHLLKAFYSYCEANFEQNKLLPVYIDSQDLDLGNASPVTADDLVIRFYRRFLYKVIDRLEEFSNRVITVSFMERVFGGEAKIDRGKLPNAWIISNPF